MPKIKVKLTATNVQTSTSSFYDATKPASAHPVFSTNGPPPDGSPMLVDLPAGFYALLCGVSGTPGPFGPVTVSDENDQVLGTNPVPAEIFPTGTGGTVVRFTVRDPARAVASVSSKPVGGKPKKSKRKATRVRG